MLFRIPGDSHSRLLCAFADFFFECKTIILRGLYNRKIICDNRRVIKDGEEIILLSSLRFKSRIRSLYARYVTLIFQ